jgi:thioredoxin-like negative regulator of GroEL
MKFPLRWAQALSLGWLLGMTPLRAAEPKPWVEKDTRLASEYLSLLVEKPEYGRILDLLWELYEKHQSTGLLLDSIAKQAKAQPHPNVTLVQAHLLRKAGRREEAEALYETILRGEGTNAVALRALADLAMENSQREAALDYLKRLAATLPEGDPQRAPLLLEEGKVALGAGKAADAAAAWEKAVKLQPDNAALAREVAQLLLGAGLLENALVLFRGMAQSADPAKRIDALYDLARIEEQSDHLKEAGAVLREGLALLHFRDWRYRQFFLRLVKLHERFGQLDVLKAELLKAASGPPLEKAFADLAQFAELTVDADERIKWLRALVTAFPAAMEYRWQLVSVLIDHEGWQEAGELLDRELKNDNSDPPGLVLLRCLVDLRAGEEEKATQTLKRALKRFSAAGLNPDVEKQVLAFAREKSLDEVVEEILRGRLEREPAKAEVVMELAAFYRSRQRTADMQKVLDRYAGDAAADRRGRLNQVAGFLAGGTDQAAAEKAAREAVAAAPGGRDELLRLADVLTQNGPDPEGLALLEKAWAMSDTADKRTDVDERILALLSGEPVAKSTAPVAASTEFKLPAIFTGDGFGSDAVPADKRKAVADAVLDYALAQAAAVRGSGLRAQGLRLLDPLPGIFRRWIEKESSTVLGLLPKPTQERTARAAWWCFRADRIELASELLNQLGAGAPPDVQKLWLDIALAEKNPLLAVRQLRLLPQTDPAGRTGYLLQLAEQELARIDGAGHPGLGEARRILEALAEEEPQNEAVLSALAQCYMVEGRREDVLALWDKAVRGAKGNVAPLLERQAEALIAQRKFAEFIAVQSRLLEEETDFKRRRESFQRALERLMWADSRQGEITEEQRKTRLDLAAGAFREQAQRHPFDGFWHEALAQIFERQGDPARAFAEMKQAYYTAPDTPFSLDQLRSSALRAGDMKSAIYFQKQIAAGAAAKEAAGEWRELVQLLEQDFRTAEADQVRRRLESRFSQDPPALEELAKFYSETAQEDAARRVFAQITRVRPWEPRNLLRLALAQRRLGETAKAGETLTKLLRDIVAPAEATAKAAVEKLPWPLLDERKTGAGLASTLLAAIENAPGLETREREQLRIFFSVPRDELEEIPDEPGHVRLRAVEELARLGGRLPHLPGLSEMELAWWHFHSGAGADFRALIAPKFTEDRGAAPGSPEGRFLYAWLMVRSHGMADAIGWVRTPGLRDELRRSRNGLLLAVVNVLAEGAGFEFSKRDLETLGAANLLSSAELIDVARKLEGRRRHDDALVLGEAALRQMSQPGEVLLHSLASIAASAGRVEDQRRYLEELWRLPIESATAKGFSSVMPGGARREPEQDLLWYYERLGHSVEAAPPRTADAFCTGLEGLLRLARTPAERETLLAESWRRLQQLAPSGQKALWEARVLGFAGADEAGAKRLANYLKGGFMTARSYLEPMIGRLPPGMQAPGPRIDEVNHMRGYWDELREWGAELTQEGLAGMAQTADLAVAEAHGGVPLGPRTNPEFNAWRVHSLLRRLRAADFPDRQRLVKEHLDPDDSVDVLVDLGNQLEAQGYARECIDIYRRLPGRAPSNGEYSVSYMRVCEVSWDVAPALPYLERIFDPNVDPVFKPLTINFEDMREKHARFLALLHDEDTLRHLAFREAPPVKMGRIPEQVPYLREFALLQERRGDTAGALAAWEQLSSRWPEDDEAALHRAQFLAAQGNRERALEALRKMPAANFWNETARKGLELRARLVAEAGQWDEMRELMILVTTTTPTGIGGAARPVHAGVVVALARILSEHRREAEAQSLLVRGERSVKDDGDRFRLRLEQLRLASLGPAWDPRREAARIAAMLRLEAGDEASLQELRGWVSGEAAAGRAEAWFALLNEAAPRANVTLALAALGRAAAAKETHFAAEKLKGGIALRLATETLLDQSQPALALRLAGPVSPLAVRALGALNDESGLRETFGRVVRMSFPGGRETVEYAEAFAACGRSGLAAELYGLALDRLRATAQIHPDLVKSYAKFLVGQRRFEEAETFLLQAHQGVTQGLPGILVDLYRGWNKLDRIGTELAKFHLPGGVAEEVKFLVATESKKK